MKTKITITAIALLLISLATQITACNKKENQAPLIVIDEPANDAMIMLPDSAHIEGSVSDDNELHELSVVVKNHGGSVVFEQYPTVHALKTFNFHYHFVTSDTGMYHLHVTAEDHDGGVSTKEVMFHVMQ
jgi:hypothetical protein